MTLAIYDKFITKTDSGETIPSATVSIYNAETAALAVLYTDIDGTTPAGNPVTASASGRVQVYMKAGRYNITAVSNGSSVNYPDVLVGGIFEVVPEKSPETSSYQYQLIGDGSDETAEFTSMLTYAQSNGGQLIIADPESVYNVTLPDNASDIELTVGGRYRFESGKWFDVTPEAKPYIIYVTTGSEDLSSYPPFYATLADAMASITDNSKRRPYEVQLLSGTHDAREITLKDYVDIVRSPLSGSTTIIEHNFSPLESFTVRDIFKTVEGVAYGPTENKPIRCKIKGLIIRGNEMNYAIHCDFNESNLLDIEITDCLLQNGVTAVNTASTADYALGIGIYGGQKITCNNTRFYGRYDPAQTDPWKQQGSGWIVHNRASQSRSCKVEFNDCKSLRGFYGGRVVDYGSGQNDVVSIKGGVLLGTHGNLLCFNNGLEGTIQESITVTGDVPITRVQLTQELSNGNVYKCEFPISISGFSEVFLANEPLEDGDLVVSSVYGTSALKAATTNYSYRPLGVVLNSVGTGGLVSVQKSGIAAIKYTSASIPGNTQLTNSKTVSGEVDVAITGDNIVGSTIPSSSSTIAPNRVLAVIDYGGVKP